MKAATMEVPVELVRKLKDLGRKFDSAVSRSNEEIHAADMISGLIRDKLPEPPKPDVVEECAIAFSAPGRSGQFSWGKDYECPNGRMRAALRRYRELCGLEPDPELAE